MPSTTARQKLMGIPDAPEPPKVRAVASNYTATFFGLTSLVVDILPAKLPGDKSGLKIVCPHCTDATPAHQEYHCEEHGMIPYDELGRAIDVDGVLRKVSEDEIETLKSTTVPKGVLDFSVFHATEIERETVQSGNVFRLRPQTNPALYHLIVDLVSDRKLAFVAEMTLRGSQKLYRVVARDGMLTLVELIRPGELRDVVVASGEYPVELLTELRDFAERQVSTFNPDTYRDVMRDRTAELVETKRNPDAPAPEPKPVAVKLDDGLGGLRAMLELKSTKPEPKPRKRAAKKAAPRKASAKSPA